MGKIEFSNCQDVRNQKKIQELDCPRCHEPGGIEAFVKDGILAEIGRASCREKCRSRWSPYH